MGSGFANKRTRAPSPVSSAIIHVPTSAFAYEAALEGLTRLDEQLLTEFEFPRLYDAGVRYKREAGDVWRHVGDVYPSKWGDCEDLAAWRAAELRVSGEDPDAFIYVYRSGPHSYHAVVGRGDDRIEDPSLILGMPVSAKRRKLMPRFVGENYGIRDGVLGAQEQPTEDAPSGDSDGRFRHHGRVYDSPGDDSDGSFPLYGRSYPSRGDDASGAYDDDSDPNNDADSNDDDPTDSDDPYRGDEAPPPPLSSNAPRKSPGKARRVFNAAKRLHNFGAKFAPHNLAARIIPKKLQLHRYIPGIKKLHLWGIGEDPVAGFSPDPQPGNMSISFDLFNTGKGWSGVIRIPTTTGRALLMSSTAAPSQAAAATKSLNMAKAAMSHPLLKAAMPPQAAMAMNLLQSAPAAKALSVLKRFRR